MNKMIILLLLTINCYCQDSIQTKILNEINIARQDPCKYGLKRIKSNFLCNIPCSKPLKYNKDISVLCERWANKMYLTNTFDHDYEDQYHNESIYWGRLNSCIPELLIDTPDENNLSDNYGHRKHLLAMEYPYNDDKEIGIGYVKIKNRYIIVIRSR